VGEKPYFRYDINVVPAPIILGAQGQGTCRACGRSTLLDQNGIHFSLADKPLNERPLQSGQHVNQATANRPNAAMHSADFFLFYIVVNS